MLFCKKIYICFNDGLSIFRLANHFRLEFYCSKCTNKWSCIACCWWVTILHWGCFLCLERLYVSPCSLAFIRFRRNSRPLFLRPLSIIRGEIRRYSISAFFHFREQIIKNEFIAKNKQKEYAIGGVR
jgi:hypothetical protein